MIENIYLAIDPGRDKCGIAVIKETVPLELQSVAVSDFNEKILEISKKHDIKAVILGNGTGHEDIKKLLLENFSLEKIHIVDETDTTLLGRQLYWQYEPAKGLKKFLPQGLRVPDKPVDAYAALAIFLRWKN